jgi:hypothetical protein
VAAGTPLSYIILKDISATPEQRTATYPTVDDDLIVTPSHSTASYCIDNGTVLDLLKPLVIGGEGWAYILKFNNDCDGNKSLYALEVQAEGPAAIITHKTEAYTSIEKASYSCHSVNYTFDMYVSAHLTSHNELNLLGETISLFKKVIDFLAGITAPSLSTAKENVIGDVNKLENFDACQKYMTQILLAQKARKQGPSSTISAVNTTTVMVIRQRNTRLHHR